MYMYNCNVHVQLYTEPNVYMFNYVHRMYVILIVSILVLFYNQIMQTNIGYWLNAQNMYVL